MNISNSGKKLRSNYSKILVNYRIFAFNIIISQSMPYFTRIERGLTLGRPFSPRAPGCSPYLFANTMFKFTINDDLNDKHFD